MTVSTFFPDADPETTSVDGYATRTTEEAWGTKRAGAGLSASAVADFIRAMVDTNAAGTFFNIMARGVVLFDTSSIPDGDTIDSATFEFVVTVKDDTFAEAGSLRMVTSNPGTNTDVVAADFNLANFSDAEQAPDLTIASLVADSATYTVMTLNATGRGNISKTGVSKFGTRLAHDATNTQPTLAASKSMRVDFASAEEALAGDKRPKLVVTHTPPPVTFIPKMLVF